MKWEQVQSDLDMRIFRLRRKGNENALVTPGKNYYSEKISHEIPIYVIYFIAEISYECNILMI